VRLAILAGAILALLNLTAPSAAAGDSATPQRWESLIGTEFQNYGPDQGLPPVLPTALAQDADGFLWVGTQSALIRWDGYRFRIYDATTDGAARGLPPGWIDALHTDAAGVLWVGTEANGLARYDRNADRFIPTPLGPARNPSRHIAAIVDDGRGGIWVGTDEGLYQIARGVSRNHLPGERIRALLVDRQGRLWIGKDKGLARWNPGSKAPTPVSIPGEEANDIQVSALFEDADGRIWIGTTQHGLYSIDPGDQAVRPFDGGDSTGWTPRTGRISAIAAAGEHEIWVGMRTDGIVAINTATHQIRRIRHDQLVPNSLSHDDVWAMMSDRAGSVWIGDVAGLSYHPREAGNALAVFGDTRRPNGVTDPDVSAVLPTTDGRIWLGFLSGGANIIDPIVGRVARLRPDPAHPDTALPRDTVAALAEAADGAVYIGTARGLYRANRRGSDLKLFRPPGRDPRGSVRALLVDGASLWIGGPDGLWRTPIGAGAPATIGPRDFLRRLSNLNVYSLLAGAKGELWIGQASGLDRLDIASGAIETIRVAPAGSPGLVSTLLTGPKGRLWVGTFGGGIAVMTGRDAAGRPQFRQIGVADGLPNLNVDQLLLDGAGLVWASTDGGLAVIDPANFRVRSIQRANGSALTIYWATSGATDQWGEPIFGAQGGMTVIRPGWPPAVPAPAPVVVTDVRIGGKSIAGGRFNGEGSTDPLVLTPRTNSLAVEFSALDFSGPQHNLYAYRLSGFDRNWIETDATRRIAAYTNLPPGRYLLELRGSNRDGVWNPAEVRIPIEVLAKWYQTLWAKLALALIVIAAAPGAVVVVERRRTANLRRRQAELEEQIAARTADLSAANARLSELATTDPLTGCANRRHFMERAQSLFELGRRTTPVSLAILDLDHFKLINDAHGHPAGDEVLRMVGQTIREQIRATDMFGRVGGEEFAVLLPDTPADQALVSLDRLRAAVAEAEVRVGEQTIRTSASLGLAEQRPDEDFATLYARADAALYEAKATGRGRVVVG
jgi:diguanylate cyclase (GGDEF)-like protein